MTLNDAIWKANLLAATKRADVYITRMNNGFYTITEEKPYSGTYYVATKYGA
jgi:hypothetical protein